MDNGTPTRHTVVAAVLRQQGRALLVHRSAHRRWYPDVWDLPGGHVEDGEAPQAALVRELREELGVVAEVVGAPVAFVRAQNLQLDVWVVDRWEGTPTNSEPDEHDALAWLGPDELQGLRLAHPGLPALLRSAL